MPMESFIGTGEVAEGFMGLGWKRILCEVVVGMGTSRIWQIGHSPGLSETIWGCIAQWYSVWAAAAIGAPFLEQAVKPVTTDRPIKRINDLFRMIHLRRHDLFLLASFLRFVQWHTHPALQFA